MCCSSIVCDSIERPYILKGKVTYNGRPLADTTFWLVSRYYRDKPSNNNLEVVKTDAMGRFEITKKCFLPCWRKSVINYVCFADATRETEFYTYYPLRYECWYRGNKVITFTGIQYVVYEYFCRRNPDLMQVELNIDFKSKT